jgi:hypothetical protein
MKLAGGAYTSGAFMTGGTGNRHGEISIIGNDHGATAVQMLTPALLTPNCSLRVALQPRLQARLRNTHVADPE